MTNADYIQQLNSIRRQYNEMFKKIGKDIYSELSVINQQYLNTFSKYKVGDVLWFESYDEYELHQIVSINFSRYDWFEPTGNYKYILWFLEQKVNERDLYITYSTRKYQKSGVLGVKYNQIYNVEDGLKVGEVEDFDTPKKIRNHFKLCEDNK